MISVAVQKGNFVYVYNERNTQIAVKQGTLVGFTSSTYSIKVNNFVYTFDSSNRLLSTH